MKKLFCLIAVAGLLGGCLPQNTEDYTVNTVVNDAGVLRYDVSVALTLDEGVAEDDLEGVASFVCFAENLASVSLAEIKREAGREVKESDELFYKFSCEPDESATDCEFELEGREFRLTCDVTRFVTRNQPFSIVLNNTDDEDTVTIGVSPELTPEALGIEIPEGAGEEAALPDEDAGRVAAGNGDGEDFDPNADIAGSVKKDRATDNGGKDDKGGCSLNIGGHSGTPDTGWVVILLSLCFLANSRRRLAGKR